MTQAGTRPPLTALRAFEALARRGSMRRAARDLNVDPSVVSRHVRQLQLCLGVQLVTSRSRGAKLTPAGVRLASGVTTAFTIMASATERLLREASIPTIISVPEAFGVCWLMPRFRSLPRFAQDYELLINHGARDLGRLLDQVDAAIVFGTPEGPDIRVQTLCKSRLFPVVSPAWLQGRCPTLDMLRDASLIHPSDDGQWRRWYAQCRLPSEGPIRGLRVASVMLALEAARQGHGVVLANEYLVADDLARGRLVELGQTDIRMHPYSFVTHRSLWDRPRIARLRRWLVEELSEQPSERGLSKTIER